jgi:GNAT superfamily N-acetyltransferase
VLFDSCIVGFATVPACAIERTSLPSARLRKRLPAYPLPVLRVARLGVDTRVQGMGIGKALLRHLMVLAVEQRHRFGCIGMVVDATPESVSFQEGLGFVPVSGVREGLLHGDPQPMFLAFDTLAAALEA